MQRLSLDTPSPRALPLLLGCSEPGTLCSECCARVSWAPGRPAPSRHRVQQRLRSVRLGGGSKTGPTWGSRALPTPPGREGKPRQKDLAPAPGWQTLRQGPGSPVSSLHLSTPAQNPWKPRLCPVPSALQEPVRLLGEASWPWVRIWMGGRGDNVVLTLPPGVALGCRQLPHPPCTLPA